MPAKRKTLLILGIVSLLVITAGLVIGVYLTKKQQEIKKSEATSGAECSQSPDCTLLDNPAQQGTRTVDRNISYVDITDQESHRYNPGESDGGCRRVTITGGTIEWNRYGTGDNCKQISNIQIWQGGATVTPVPTATPRAPTPTLPPGVTPTPTPTPTTFAFLTPVPTAKCSEVKAYNLLWVQLSTSQLANLKAGGKVRFTVRGEASSGTFDKAKFKINDNVTSEITAKKPESDEFYYEYTIPAGVTTYSVGAQVHHSILGWVPAQI